MYFYFPISYSDFTKYIYFVASITIQGQSQDKNNKHMYERHIFFK